MTEQELQPYIGERVEVRFTNNETVIGKLVTGDLGLVLQPHPYALEILPANIGDETTWFAIPDTSIIDAIRLTERRQR